MIGALFQFVNEVIEVRIDGFNVLFRNSQTHGGFTTIDGLKLSRSGVIKEFPDLENKENWREEAIKRFKEKIKKFNSEDKRMNYVIEDLKKFGYKPLYLNKQGFRPKKL